MQQINNYIKYVPQMWWTHNFKVGYIICHNLVYTKEYTPEPHPKQYWVCSEGISRKVYTWNYSETPRFFLQTNHFLIICTTLIYIKLLTRTKVLRVCSRMLHQLIVCIREKKRCDWKKWKEMIDQKKKRIHNIFRIYSSFFEMLLTSSGITKFWTVFC